MGKTPSKVNHKDKSYQCKLDFWSNMIRRESLTNFIMATSNDNNTLNERDPEELFRLKWNDFTDNVMSTMSDIRHEEDFFDVTLAIDGRQLRAHKLILSA